MQSDSHFEVADLGNERIKLRDNKMKFLLNRLHMLSTVGLFCVAIAACTPSEDQAETSSEQLIRPVKVAKVQSATTEINRTYSAVVLAAEEVQLSFRVSGRIVELAALAGTNVKKGDVIAQLDRRDFKAEITRLESQLEQAEAQLTALTSGARVEDLASLEAGVAAVQAQVDAAIDQLKRTQTLFKKKIVTKAKVDQDTTNLRVVEAELEAKKQELKKGQSGARAEDVAAQKAVIKGLKSNLQSLNDNLSDTTLTAPFDGIIATRSVDNFSNIQAKETVATLQNLASPKLQFDVPAPDVVVLAKIEKRVLMVELDGLSGQTFAATGNEFSTKADSATQTYRGTASIQNPNGEPILPGMTGSITVTAEAGGEAKLLVPVSAVASDASGKPYVWLVDLVENKVSKQSVETGAATGASIVVKNGLKKDDVIATAGLSALQDNLVIKPVTTVGE